MIHSHLVVEILAPIKYVSFDFIVEVWLKIIANRGPALKSHSRIMFGPPLEKFAHF